MSKVSSLEKNKHTCQTDLFNRRTAPLGLKHLPTGISGRRSIIAKAYQQAKPGLIVKPGRSLGAVWLDQFVSGRTGVNLCAVCVRLYGGPLQHPKYSYLPDLVGLKLGDCDGCGGTGQPETLYPYYPSEKFNGLRLKPNQNLIVKGVT